MGGRTLVDTAVFAYALGGAHEQRDACRAVIAAAERGVVELHASIELVQELVHHRMRRTNRADAVRQAQLAAAVCVLHPFDRAVLDRSLALVARTTLGGRDAVHAATGLLLGISVILSPDRDYDGVPGLRRVDPVDLEL
ncbi:hypothetical protein CLV28_1034 [Sediminihabitans luteus]|uniref:Ribonuclease VapC n=1 Tax=Sediminihabitans luteus TaxID=1138585 RepID=A0A2M9D1E4_9CELL|nr:type II toxin-antitoxin system VapC family toxin [Sediminihabitans luteus]PJJ77808.1 hypothetical protein CLV28_1034 [Sediminihabitans luteus]